MKIEQGERKGGYSQEVERLYCIDVSMEVNIQCPRVPLNRANLSNLLQISDYAKKIRTSSYEVEGGSL